MSWEIWLSHSGNSKGLFYWQLLLCVGVELGWLTSAVIVEGPLGTRLHLILQSPSGSWKNRGEGLVLMERSSLPSLCEQKHIAYPVTPVRPWHSGIFISGKWVWFWGPCSSQSKNKDFLCRAHVQRVILEYVACKDGSWRSQSPQHPCHHEYQCSWTILRARGSLPGVVPSGSAVLPCWTKKEPDEACGQFRTLEWPSDSECTTGSLPLPVRLCVLQCQTTVEPKEMG